MTRDASQSDRTTTTAPAEPSTPRPGTDLWQTPDTIPTGLRQALTLPIALHPTPEPITMPSTDPPYVPVSLDSVVQRVATLMDQMSQAQDDLQSANERLIEQLDEAEHDRARLRVANELLTGQLSARRPQATRRRASSRRAAPSWRLIAALAVAVLAVAVLASLTGCRHPDQQAQDTCRATARAVYDAVAQGQMSSARGQTHVDRACTGLDAITRKDLLDAERLAAMVRWADDFAPTPRE